VEACGLRGNGQLLSYCKVGETNVKPSSHPSTDFGDQTVEVVVARNPHGQLEFVQQACLVVLAGPRIGQRVALQSKPLTIGRGSKSKLIFDADSVSRRHSSIEWSGGRHRVKDLGSTNGTFVNETRINEHVLEDGDRIQLGRVLLKYISGSNIENAYHAEIQRLTHFDGLTGVGNRRHFDEALAQEVAVFSEHMRPLSLILFDLDHFKQVNDKYGHPAGDSVLRQVAEVVSQTMGPELLLARTGGEEFAVLCAGVTEGAAQEIAESIRLAVEQARFIFDGTHIPTTLSLGVAEMARARVPDGKSLFSAADARLYAAKSAGRNCVRAG